MHIKYLWDLFTDVTTLEVDLHRSLIGQAWKISMQMALVKND